MVTEKASQPTDSAIIDAHQHFWTRARSDYPFLVPSAAILFDDYLPLHLLPELQARHITGTITVQATATVAETQWLLDMANGDATIRGVVGWLPVNGSSFTFRRQLAKLRQHSKLVGLRPMLQDLPRNDWICDPPVLRNLRHLAAVGIPLDLLIYSRHIPHVREMLENVPGLHAVVDHAAKPAIRDRQWEPWASELRTLAPYARVFCKLSGLVTEAEWTMWRAADLDRYVAHVIDTFGPARVMFGSDWPVCLQAASYGQVFETLWDLVDRRVSASERARIFGLNALRFYPLPPAFPSVSPTP